MFDLDGVLAASAGMHAGAWAEVFDPFLMKRAGGSREGFRPFDRRNDYREFVGGRRGVGARLFLASRGIHLPEGSSDDQPGTDTVYGLTNEKNRVLRDRLQRDGVAAFAGSRSYLEGARMLGIRRAVVSESANTESFLAHAGLAQLIEQRIDAEVFETERLSPKPAPDSVLAACRRLEVDPSEVAAFETTTDGIAAARRAGVRLVIAVDRDGRTKGARTTGADMVVHDLAQVVTDTTG